jgi:hypothetical protein
VPAGADGEAALPAVRPAGAGAFATSSIYTAAHAADLTDTLRDAGLL